MRRLPWALKTGDKSAADYIIQALYVENMIDIKFFNECGVPLGRALLH